MEINKPDILVEVSAALEAYLAALDANDLEGLDAFFWDSEHTVRFGAGESLIGKSQIRAFRQGRGKRSPISIDRTLIVSFGDDVASVNLLFSRANTPGAVGRWTLHWARFDGTWRITAAHLSSLQPAPTGGGGA